MASLPVKRSAEMMPSAANMANRPLFSSLLRNSCGTRKPSVTQTQQTKEMRELTLLSNAPRCTGQDPRDHRNLQPFLFKGASIHEPPSKVDSCRASLVGQSKLYITSLRSQKKPCFAEGTQGIRHPVPPCWGPPSRQPAPWHLHAGSCK